MRTSIAITCAAIVFILSCNTQPGEQTDTRAASVASLGASATFDTIYNSQDYIVLARKSGGVKSLLNHGRPVDDDSALMMINDYRNSTAIPANLKTGYLDFTYRTLFEHLRLKGDSITKGLPAGSTQELGIRIYPGLEDKKLNALITLTLDGQAIWLDRRAPKLSYKNAMQIEAYNFSGLCPEVCGDDEDKGKFEVKK